MLYLLKYQRLEKNLDKLKETILLQAEILDLKAFKDGQAKGIVLGQNR